MSRCEQRPVIASLCNQGRTVTLAPGSGSCCLLLARVGSPWLLLFIGSCWSSVVVVVGSSRLFPIIVGSWQR
eukprot:563897-Lingulodinium_polyedra.AAC.1